MAIDPATVATVVKIGIDLYEFVDKLSNKGQKGDQLQPIVAKLDQIKASINAMGEALRKGLDGVVDQIIDDIRLTQQSRLPAAHAAITDYLRTHPNLPDKPDVNNPNYVTARTITLEVKTYFMSHNELAFMGGFIQAMNARIEFMTSLDHCWFSNNPEYIDELRAGVNHLNNYIGYCKSRIGAGIVTKLSTKFAITDPDMKPPLKEPVSYTAQVLEGGNVLWSQSAPATDDQPTKLMAAANAARIQRVKARQKEVMGGYDQIAATWNGLIASSAAAAAMQALLPRAESRIDVGVSPALTVAALPEPDADAFTGEYDLPLREAALQILDTQEFHERLQRTGGARAVTFWFQKAFDRKPTDEEAETLGKVLELFGQKAFFRALAYSSEYENRWASGLPAA